MVVVEKVILVSVHVRYFSFFSFFSLCQSGYVRLLQVMSGYIRLHQVTSVYVVETGRGARQQGQDRDKTGTRQGQDREKTGIRQGQDREKTRQDRDQ